MPPKSRVHPYEGSKMHLLPPSGDRANLRSATPNGFARAVFRENATFLMTPANDNAYGKESGIVILKGSQRGGGKQLAAHLMKVEDNEHVHIQ